MFTTTMHQTVKYEKHSLLVLQLQHKTFPGLTHHEIAEIATWLMESWWRVVIDRFAFNRLFSNVSEPIELTCTPMSGVFRTIDPPPPLPLASVSFPLNKGRGTHSPGVGGQYFGRRQTLYWLLQYNPSTGTPLRKSLNVQVHSLHSFLLWIAFAQFWRKTRVLSL